MTPESWKQVSDAFHQALNLSGLDREEFIDALDPTIAFEVRSLIQSHESSESFLEDPLGPRVAESIAKNPSPLANGHRVGDFEVVRLLGKGSFGSVYLARQTSLNRQVALKISMNVGSEALTMAQLEHDNIVRVFSETVDPQTRERHICMQFVPGVSLEKILKLARERQTETDGKVFLSLVDSHQTDSVAFDPVSFREREQAEKLDAIGLTLWISVKLAEALAYAHERGVLHLDVKPANILVTPFARPLLSDFNISIRRQEDGSWENRPIGGTLEFMSPEQKRFFQNSSELRPSVDERSDIYSLGIVIQELRRTLVRVSNENPSLFGLKQIIARATAHRPEDRFQSARELVQTLYGCLELKEIQAQLPDEGIVTRITNHYPLFSFVIFTILPQLLGSVVNISYNAIRVVEQLSFEQQAVFKKLCIYYNSVSYPLCFFLLASKTLPAIRFFRDRLDGNEWHSPESLAEWRKRVLRLPLWIVIVTTLGWMPGSLFFPAAIQWQTTALPSSIYSHFFVSFTISWLVALTYSFLYAQFAAVRIYYPRFWLANDHIRSTAEQELEALRPGMRVFQFSAGCIPLIAAALIVYVGPDQLDAEHFSIYRNLVTLLIASGMVGLVFAIRSASVMSQTFFAFVSRNGGRLRVRQ